MIDRRVDVPQAVRDVLAWQAGRLGVFGRDLRWYAEISSTNDVAGAEARAGAAEGLVVVADAQRAGRGRLGRVWASPPGAGLYVSVVLRPPPDVAGLVPLVAGVALADGIDAATGLSPELKWPNDLTRGGRKLAGILAEAGKGLEGRPHVILGCGVNIEPAAYPPEIGARATSLAGELGHACDRAVILAAFLASLAARYADLAEGRHRSVVQAWRARARHTFGRHVTWIVGATRREGLVRDVADDGRLIVEALDGHPHFVTGEVQWV